MSGTWRIWETLPGVALEYYEVAGSGPQHVLITGGIHGDEYEGPAAIAEFVAKLETGKIRGSVTAIPVANPLAFATGSRNNPDGLNLARCFPGQEQGALTERLAAAFFRRFVSRATHLIDLHSGGLEYTFLPLTGFYGAASESNPSFQSANVFGLSVVWQLPETPGVLSFEAHCRGVVSVGAEYFGAGQLREDGIAAYRAGIERCLVSWQVYDAPLDVRKNVSVLSGDWQLAGRKGLIRNQVTLGQTVEAGQPLCKIVDLQGRTLQAFRASRSGVVAGLRSKAQIKSGNWAVLVLGEHCGR